MDLLIKSVSANLCFFVYLHRRDNGGDITKYRPVLSMISFHVIATCASMDGLERFFFIHLDSAVFLPYPAIPLLIRLRHDSHSRVQILKKLLHVASTASIWLRTISKKKL